MIVICILRFKFMSKKVLGRCTDLLATLSKIALSLR